jgi:hypothetical protein
MRLVLCNYVYTALGIALLASSTEGFTSQFSRSTFLSRQVNAEDIFTELHAKKKQKATVDFDAFDDDEPMSKKDQLKAEKAAKKASKKQAAAPKVDPKAAALEALGGLDFDDEPMSAKEKAKMEKQKQKEAKKSEQGPPGNVDKKKAAALKALEQMERMEAQMAAESNDDDADSFGIPKKKLSKKELKALKKKEDKDAAKKAAKEAKKAARAESGEEVVPDMVGANGESGTESETPVSIQCVA